jgi:hypothetical protein
VSETIANVRDCEICAVGLATCAVSECQVPSAEGQGAGCPVTCARVPSAEGQMSGARCQVSRARCQVPCARMPSAVCQNAVCQVPSLCQVPCLLQTNVTVAVFRDCAMTGLTKCGRALVTVPEVPPDLT